MKINDYYDENNALPRIEKPLGGHVEAIPPEDVEIISPDNVGRALADAEKGPDVITSEVGSGNGVAVNAAGAKITVGVGEINNSKGAGTQITNMTGDINFGNVRSNKFSKILPNTQVESAPQLSDGYSL